MRSFFALLAVFALTGLASAAPAVLPETTTRLSRTLFRDRIASTTTSTTTSTPPSRTLFRDRQSSTSTPAAPAQPTFTGTGYGISNVTVHGQSLNGFYLYEKLAPYNACPDPSGALAAHKQKGSEDYALISPSFAVKHGGWTHFCGKNATITRADHDAVSRIIVGECAEGYCPEDGIAFIRNSYFTNSTGETAQPSHNPSITFTFPFLDL
ncbi:hypothetical protein JCM8097_000448 [Rhodosporidiobolus ruineniae]